MNEMQDNPLEGAKQAFAKKNEYDRHRDWLKAVSSFARILVKEGAFSSVNEYLLQMYAEQGHEELATIYEWNSRGYSVKKGSKALPIWGKPKPLQKGKEEKAEQDEEDKADYFPVCYMFSNAMVERKQPKR
jgi:hypothetical protein